MKNLILAAVFLLSGCAIAELRTGHNEGDFSIADQNKGRDILKTVADQGGWVPGAYSRLDVTAVDNWNMFLLRWLTPVRSDHQKLQFSFGLKSVDVLMAPLDGPGVGDSAGLQDGQTFKIINGRTIKKYYWDVQTYCIHVRRYFLWPYILAQMPAVAFLKEDSMNGQTYDLVFAGYSMGAANSKEDQYILWVNRQSKQVDYVEFTLRSLLSSYRGAAAYKDYRDVGGVRFAFDITLLNHLGGQGYSHHLVAQSIRIH